jgi:hypothetical protein
MEKGGTTNCPLNTDRCPAGYFCGKGTPCNPSASNCTDSAPTPKYGICNVAGQFCPATSTTKDGAPVLVYTSRGVTYCAKNANDYCGTNNSKKPKDPYCDFCKENKDDPYCDKYGYKGLGYCVDAITEATENPIDPFCSARNASCKCGNGYFCPAGNVGNKSEKGRPAQQDTSSPCTGDDCKCDTNAECKCAAGFFCPTASTNKFGAGTETGNAGSRENFCIEKSKNPTEESPAVSRAKYENEQCKCGAGFYCPEATSFIPKQCDAGFYCPQGSTAGDGQPIGDGCKSSPSDNDNKCICQAGYYCPSSSTTNKGKPAYSYKKENVDICTSGTECRCASGYFCPSAANKGSVNEYGGICPLVKNDNGTYSYIPGNVEENGVCKCPTGALTANDSSTVKYCYIEVSGATAPQFQDTNNGTIGILEIILDTVAAGSSPVAGEENKCYYNGN